MRKSSKLKQLSCSCSRGASASIFVLCLSVVFFFMVFEVLPGSTGSRSSWVSSTRNPWISTAGFNVNIIAEHVITYTKNASSIIQESKRGQTLDVVRVHHDQVQELKRNDSSAEGRDHHQVQEVKRNDSSVIRKHKESINNTMTNNGSDIYIAPMRTRTRKEYSQLETLEVGLARARTRIAKVARNGPQLPDPVYTPRGPIYRNDMAFQRSYLEMEKSLKVFIYEEGEPPLFHTASSKSLYAIEGVFINELEVSKFRTRNAEEAQVFFLPFSVVMMVQYIFDPNSYDSSPFNRTINDFINIIAHKHPYWNRSLGADHFMVSCHDWAPIESAFNSYLYKNSIRVLCNANTSEGFNPLKDAALPEILLPTGEMPRPLGGPSPSQRPILAFFAGRLHGPVRPILLKHWKEKDPDMQVYEYLPKSKSYDDLMKKSRYCLCPSGYEVASPRVVEALYTGCVPVLISDAYVPPFSDVLNWNAFSVIVPPSEIPNLKKILMGISQRRYVRLQQRGVQVRRHFEVNSPTKRFDVFHMLLHSVWLRRLNIRIHDDHL